MTEDKKPFTVSDRRHFTPEGAARKVEEEQPANEGQRARPQEKDPGASRAARSESRPPGPPMDFIGLLVSLGAQAALLLGGAAAGQEGPPPDPEGARAFITLLEVLQEKTQGRRTPEEDQVLEGLLYQLRMEYLARAPVKGA